MSPFSLGTSIWIDAFTLLVCAILLVGHPRMRHSHPAVIYLIFHAVVFTFRAHGVAAGAPVFLQMTDGEASWALNLADLFLIALTLGWLTTPLAPEVMRRPSVQLRGDVIIGTSIVAVPIGLYTMLQYARLPGVRTDSPGIETSYQTLAITWPGLMLVALIYKFGFRAYLLVPLSAYLLIMAVQGESRTRLILPAILVVQIWLDRRGRKWPTPAIAGGLVGLMLVFYPLDQIGAAFQQGTLNVETFREIVAQSTSSAVEAQNSEQNLFDMYAVGVAQGDHLGTPLYGRHYLDLLALPIPRPWWPDKPGTADHIAELSSPSRPLATMGTILTVPGEIYVDFRTPGILIAGFVLARLSGRFFRRAYGAGYGSVTHFLYLLVAAILIQVYRDGLHTLPIFFFVYNLPLVAIAAIHYLTRQREELVHEEAAEVVRHD